MNDMIYPKTSDVLLIIPAYNEEGNIIRTIEELEKDFSGYDYLVINDGSQDMTGEICRSRGYRHISMPVNIGLAGTFRTGMKYADRCGYKFALQYDGDGQHLPQYISQMLAEMQKKNGDIVIGSRFLGKKPDITLRGLGSRMIQGLIKMTTGMTITDPTSGMRMYNRRMIRLFANDINLPPEPDAIALLIRKGYKICEVSVEMRERQAGQSYLNPGSVISYMVNMCVSIVFIQWFRRDRKK